MIPGNENGPGPLTFHYRYLVIQYFPGFVPIGTTLKNPNFAAMAETIGMRGIRIEDPARINDGIAAAFAHDGPVLIDAVVNRSELAMPPAITVEMAKGFSLYMLRAVMNGQADQVIDLAESNLWR